MHNWACMWLKSGASWERTYAVDLTQSCQSKQEITRALSLSNQFLLPLDSLKQAPDNETKRDHESERPGRGVVWRRKWRKEWCNYILTYKKNVWVTKCAIPHCHKWGGFLKQESTFPWFGGWQYMLEMPPVPQSHERLGRILPGLFLSFMGVTDPWHSLACQFIMTSHPWLCQRSLTSHGIAFIL